MKILVTVGTHNQSFDHLLQEIALWAGRTEHQWIVQSGSSLIRIEGAHQKDFFDPQEFLRLIREVDLVVSHVGCGIVREVQEAGTPALLTCRLSQRDEHLDDHQIELQEALQSRKGLRFFDLGADLEALAHEVIKETPHKPESVRDLIGNIKDWLKVS